MSAGAPETVIDNSWRAHVAGTLRVGLPLILAQLAQSVIQVTDTVMLGWYGTQELAAVVLGTTLWFVAFIVGIGIAQAIMPLAASAAGADNPRGVRRSVRMGLWAVWLSALILIPVLYQGEALFLLTGQEPALASLADDYLVIALWGLLPAVTVMALRAFLSAMERTSIVMWATFGGAAINAAGNWALIFGNWGAPELGVQGAAIASATSHLVTLVPVALFCARHHLLRPYRIFVRIWRPDWPALAEVFRLGVPITGTLLAEMGLFTAAALMMGWLGTVTLAAHGIALQIISVIFMIPLGFSQAATARIGRAHGRGDGLGIARAARTALSMSLGVAVAGAVVLWLMPERLIDLFLADDDGNAAAVIATGTVLLAVAAVFQVVDTLQVVAAGLLRGLKDTRVPFLIAVLSYWGAGVPLAYVLGFPMDLGGAGIWMGLAAGLFFAATLLTLRYVRRERVAVAALPAG